MRGLRRPENRDPCASAFGSHGKAPQLLVARAREPRYERMAACRTQHLLNRPEHIAPLRRAHQRKPGLVDAAGSLGRRVRLGGGRYHYDALSGPGERGERRQHELELADARASGKKLGQRAAWPAAAGQLAVERIEAGGCGRCTGGERPAAPDWMPPEDLFQCRHRRVFIYSIGDAGKPCRIYMENKNLMLRAVFACLLACVLAFGACAVPAQEPVQVWLDPGFFSYHFKDGNYRQDNYGIGVGVFVAPEHGFIAGTFFNSDDERSRYLGYHWRPLDWNPWGISVRGGLVFALVDGYSNTNDGHAFPVVIPALTVEYRRVGANFLIAPHPHNGTAIALQLRLRVW